MEKSVTVRNRSGRAAGSRGGGRRRPPQLSDRERREQALARFLMVAFLVCLAIVVEPLGEVIAFHLFGFAGAWSFGRNAMFVIADTSVPEHLLKLVAEIVALALAVMARPRKRAGEWTVLMYGSMVGLGCCLLMILLYQGVPPVYNDLDELSLVGAKYPELHDPYVSDLKKDESLAKVTASIAILYGSLAAWFGGLIIALASAPKKPAPTPEVP